MAFTEEQAQCRVVQSMSLVVPLYTSRSSGRHDTNRRWAEAARKMAFTEEQAEKLLGVRREHLRRLHRIYEDRRQVNLEAISVLVRPPFHMPPKFPFSVCLPWSS